MKDLIDITVPGRDDSFSKFYVYRYRSSFEELLAVGEKLYIMHVT